VTQPKNKSAKDEAARERLHDRAISILLATIWLVAAFLVYRSNREIPMSMLIIGTIFFIMLVPAMKELVKVIDRRVKIELGLIDPVDE
jgi:hypothetical protein